MAVNLIPRQIELLIGGVDRSDSFVSFSGSDSKADGSSGLITFTGQIIIQAPGLTIPSWMNVIQNPGNFSRGVPVLFSQNGTLHPRGRLYILKNPSPATYSSVSNGLQLNLEVGCVLALNSFRTPFDDKSEVEYGVSTLRRTIAQRLLNAAGMGSYSCNIPGTLNYPIPRQTGSYLDQLGKLALATGHIVRANHASTSQLEVIALPTIASGISAQSTTLNPATEAVELSSIAGAETPIEDVIVTGQTYEVGPQAALPTVTEKKDGTGKVIQRITRTDSWNETTKTRTKTTKTEMIRSKAIPEEVYKAATSIIKPLADTLIVSDLTTEVEQFELDGERRLLSVTTTKLQPYGVCLAEWIKKNGSLVAVSLGLEITFVPVTAQTSVKTIEYNTDGVIARRYETIRRMYGAIKPDRSVWDDSTQLLAKNLVDYSTVEEKWEQVRNGWRYSTDVYKPYTEVTPNTTVDTTVYPSKFQQLQAYSELVYSTDESQTVESSSGQTQPPSAERGPTDKIFREIQVKGTAKLQRFGNPDYSDRQATFQVEYLNGKGEGEDPTTTPEEQCAALAKAFGVIKAGRRASFRIITDLRDYKPFQRISISGIGILRVESATYSVASNQAVAGFDAFLEGKLAGTGSTDIGVSGSYVAGTNTVALTNPTTTYLPQGTVITLSSGGSITLTEDALEGATSLVGETTNLNGNTGTYEYPLISPTYIVTNVAQGGCRDGGASLFFPYSLTTTLPAATGGERNGGFATFGVIQTFTAVSETNDSANNFVYELPPIQMASDTWDDSKAYVYTVPPIEIKSETFDNSPTLISVIQSFTVASETTDNSYIADSDPFWSSVRILLPGTGSNGGTTFTEAKAGRPVTATGGVTTSTTQSKWGSGSIYFDGSGSYLRIAPTISFPASDYDIPGDYTVEAWIYLVAYGAAGAFWVMRDAGDLVRGGLEGFLAPSGIFANVSESGPGFGAGYSLPLNTWVHHAQSRVGNFYRCFVDGVQVSEYELFVSPPNTGGGITLGRYSNGSYNMNGYMNDFRLTIGVGRYTGNFTPPTGPLPIG